MDTLIALLVGLAAGTHAATWGMFKDAPHEGFRVRTYCRSIVVGGSLGLLLGVVSDIDATSASGIVLVFGLVYVMERGTNEFYKTFLREQDQSKYTIPMQLAVRGTVVEDRTRRLLAGAGYALGVLVVVGAIYALQEADLGLPGPLVILLVGSLGGWISAFGGAWKDAPVEGFQPFKFVRSPLVALFYATLLGFVTHSYVFIAMGALGYTVATLETFKTFVKYDTPRGKFAGKPVLYPEWLERRRRFVPAYIAISSGIVVCFFVALAQPNSGVIG